MLTRIISGAVLVACMVAIIFSTLHFHLPIIFIAFLSFLSAMAVYELLKNTGIVKNKVLITVAVVFASISQVLFYCFPNVVWYFAIGYGVFAVIMSSVEKLSYKRSLFAALMPVIICYCFSCIFSLLLLGLVHIILILNFSSVCDCGAYFVGVTLGRHKLCPKISPKKTIEGAIGGILTSMIVTIVICKLFSVVAIWKMVAITPILCVAGICGDLLASVIKRSVGIKDYGKIIPGHGGIMDRFDSILLIAPIYLFLYSLVG